MAEQCGNCGSEISVGGMLKGPNYRIPEARVMTINAVQQEQYSDLCDKCGSKLVKSTMTKLKQDLEGWSGFIRANVSFFPMMTVHHIPNARMLMKGMVTANVTVGTGIFSEMSQGLSDLFGVTNTSSGMALKVNTGEAAARTILVEKTLAIGGNCIIGVDVDYGTTTNNAATVNMQGTAVSVANLAEVLDGPEMERGRKLAEAFDRASAVRQMIGDYFSQNPYA